MSDITPGLIGSDEPKPTLLADLRAELSEQVEHKPLTLKVPNRPGYSVRYSTDIEYRRLQMITKRAQDKGLGGTDLVKWSCSVLATFCESVVRHGEDVLDDGQPVTFASKMLQEAVGTFEAVACIRKFYGEDGDIMAAASTLVTAAGLDRESLEGEETEPDPL